ncbi:MAG: hypothetical protein AAGI90_01445 [Chlamydiota bacterium]
MRFIYALLILLSPLSAQNTYQATEMRTIKSRGEAAISSSTHLIAYSMVAWGVVLGVSAAVLAGLFQSRD